MTEFDFDAFMARAAYHDSLEESKRRGGCPETSHGHHSEEKDRYGKCFYCRQQVGRASAKPLAHTGTRPILDLAYGYFYDPDFGNNYWDQY